MVWFLLMKNGPYELVVAPKDYPGFKYRGRYVYEHHLVWWKKTGDLVKLGFVLHHKNHDKRDNRFRNLVLQERSEHSKAHGAERSPPKVSVTCGTCSGTFQLKPSEYRWRLKNSPSKKLFCGRSCQVRAQQADRRK